MCWKPGRFECIPARRHGGYWEGGEQVLLPAGAQGGLGPLQDMQVGRAGGRVIFPCTKGYSRDTKQKSKKYVYLYLKKKLKN